MERYRGIKVCNSYDVKISEGWGARIWMIWDLSWNSIPNQPLKQVLEETSYGSGMKWRGSIIGVSTCKSKWFIMLDVDL